MNCNECKDLLIEFSEGLLDAHSKASVERHLEACPECRKEAESILSIQARLLKNSQDSRSTLFEQRVMNRIAREQSARLKVSGYAGFLNQIRSSLMKNTLLKIAVTAVVVFAVLFGLNFPQNNVSFARVAEPILHSRTLEYDLVILEQQVRYHEIAAEGKIRRSFSNHSWIVIIDVDNSSTLHLNTVLKTAVTIPADEIKDAKVHFDIFRDFLRLVRCAVEAALTDTPSAVKKLGKKRIDGHVVFGFELPSGTEGEEVVIWADRDTALPVQIDIRLGMSHPDSLTTGSVPSTPGEPARQLVQVLPKSYTLKNIRFDVSVEESLMEMPSDYKLVDWKQFMDLMVENNFVNMLRLWSENLSDGFFPENLPTADFRNQFMSAFPDIKEWTSEERDELITDEVLRAAGLGHIEKQFMIGLDIEEWEDFIITVSDGFGFISILEINGAEWQYSGSGVQPGEGGREIFRYKMPGSSFWRVIYGDLHVEEIAAENVHSVSELLPGTGY